MGNINYDEYKDILDKTLMLPKINKDIYKLDNEISENKTTKTVKTINKPRPRTKVKTRKSRTVKVTKNTKKI
jgi:hypothetical protein